MPQVVKVDDRVWFRDIMAGDGFVVSDLIVSRWLGSWASSPRCRSSTTRG
jgi:hypothetical protein